MAKKTSAPIPHAPGKKDRATLRAAGAGLLLLLSVLLFILQLCARFCIVACCNTIAAVCMIALYFATRVRQVTKGPMHCRCLTTRVVAAREKKARRKNIARRHRDEEEIRLFRGGVSCVCTVVPLSPLHSRAVS